MHRSGVILLLQLLLLMPALAQAQTTKPPSALRTYETPYYSIHTDVGRDGAREAEMRMTRMAEEYRQRTRGFGGELRGKLPFFLATEGTIYDALRHLAEPVARDSWGALGRRHAQRFHSERSGVAFLQDIYQRAAGRLAA